MIQGSSGSYSVIEKLKVGMRTHVRTRQRARVAQSVRRCIHRGACVTGRAGPHPRAAIRSGGGRLSRVAKGNGGQGRKDGKDRQDGGARNLGGRAPSPLRRNTDQVATYLSSSSGGPPCQPFSQFCLRRDVAPRREPQLPARRASPRRSSRRVRRIMASGTAYVAMTETTVRSRRARPADCTPVLKFVSESADHGFAARGQPNSDDPAGKAQGLVFNESEVAQLPCCTQADLAMGARRTVSRLQP